MSSADLHDAVSITGNLRDDLLRIPPDQCATGIREDPREPTNANARSREAGEQRADGGQPAGRHQYLPLAPTTELVTVSPGGELRAEWFTDPHQRGSVAEFCEAYVVGRDALSGVAIQLFRLFDRFPAFLEGVRFQRSHFGQTTHNRPFA